MWSPCSGPGIRGERVSLGSVVDKSGRMSESGRTQDLFEVTRALEPNQIAVPMAVREAFGASYAGMTRAMITEESAV